MQTLGSDETVGSWETSGRVRKRSLETQSRWRDLSRFTHLIVRPQWRSAPRSEVWTTFRTEIRLQSKCWNKRRENRPKKPRIYTRKQGSHERDKRAHLDDFLVCASGRAESSDTVVGAGLSTPITSPHLVSTSEGGEAVKKRRLHQRRNVSCPTLS